MIKTKRTERDSLINQKINLKRNHENQREAVKAAAIASFNQPVAQNENQYLTLCSA